MPRGGRSLIDRVTAESRVPVLRHYDGICHVYVDRDADIAMARDVVANAKMRRVSVCGAAETLLIDRAALDTHLMPVIAKLHELGCEVRGDGEVQKRDPTGGCRHARRIGVPNISSRSSRSRTVDGVDGAIRHIATYGSQHTKSIVTNNPSTGQLLLEHIHALCSIGDVLSLASDLARLPRIELEARLMFVVLISFRPKNAPNTDVPIESIAVSVFSLACDFSFSTLI